MPGKQRNFHHIVTAQDRKGLTEVHFRHPLNPRSEVHSLSLSLGDLVGMRRAHLAVGRIPPGKESFIYHFHRLQEEFLFILSGSGTAEIGEESFAVGPGDYMGFPIDGLGHHLINSGDGDLVYLMGGERSDTEVADFPRIGKRMIVEGDKITLFDCEDAESFQLSEWIGEAEDQA